MVFRLLCMGRGTPLLLGAALFPLLLACFVQLPCQELPPSLPYFLWVEPLVDCLERFGVFSSYLALQLHMNIWA